MTSKYPTIHTDLLDEDTSKTYQNLKEYPLKIKLLRYFRGDNKLWTSRGNTVKDPLNTLYFVLDGDGFLTFDNMTIPLLQNHIYLIPTNRTRIYGCKNFVEKYWCFFQMRNSLGTDLLDGHPEIMDLGDGLQSKKFRDLFVNPNLKKILKLQTHIYEMFEDKNLLDICLKRHDVKETKYTKVFQLIENNLSAKITTSSLAETMEMTAPGFSRAFHRDSGQTIKSYVNHRINQKACDLILLTNLKIKEIAHALDYEDEYYFIRFFKKMNGIPPLQYRVRVQQ